MKHQSSVCIILLLTTGYHQAHSNYPKKMIITVPVADLRTAPKTVPDNITLPTSAKTNPLQCSQLLLGECVVAQKEIINSDSEKWLKVHAVQQPRYAHDIGWHGFPGWIRSDQAVEVTKFPSYNLVVKHSYAHLLNKRDKQIHTLSIGTKLYGIQHNDQTYRVLLPNDKTAFINEHDVYPIDTHIQESIEELRNNIVATAQTFLGHFYSWGGRSAQHDEFGISSVDCSSFIQLIFLANGLQVPRNAHDQFLTAKRVKYGKDLQPGDMVFFDPIRSKHEPPPVRMTHVLLYIGNNNLIEATNSGDRRVRIIDFEQRIGKPRATMKSGDKSINVTTRGRIAGQYHIYFGSYLHDSKLVKKLRERAIG